MLAFGSLVAAAAAAGDELDAALMNMRFVKPLDIDLIIELAAIPCWSASKKTSVIGGAGSEIERVLAENGLTVPVFTLGPP